MRSSRFRAAALALSLCLSRAALAAPPEDVVVKALREELQRSIEKLSLPGQEKPYFIEYALVETESFSVGGTFGSIVHSDDDRSRYFKVDVRVGSYELDNSAFVTGSRPTSFPRFLVLDDDEDALRRDVWLATDAAYKQALEQLSSKRASLESRVDQEPVPDFSREKPTVVSADRSELGAVTKAATDLVRKLSGVFRESPSIQESGVRLNVSAGRSVLMNTEGTLVIQPIGETWLSVRAATQAPDGMRLKSFRSVWAPSFAELPPEAELVGEMRRLAGELSALLAAPVAEKYVGPILFEGPAATELFAQILGPQLSGQRPPLFAQPQMGANFPKSELLGRLKRLVMPRSFTVVDDPTRSDVGGVKLAGSYRVDDQGVPARPVTLIEKGILKSLLMSRRPSKEIPESNGHGRGSGFGGASASISSLFVKSSEGKSPAVLKKELIDLCSEQGLGYGFLVRALDQPSITGRDAAGPVSPFASSGSRPSLSAPLLLYKVHVPDGREELVRGAAIGEVTVRTLREIVSAGEELHVSNRFFGDDGTSVIAPSVLFGEVEVAPMSGPQQKPSLLPHPFFRKK